MKTAFETIRQATDEQLADAGLIKLSERIYVSKNAISSLDIRGENEPIFLRARGIEHQVPPDQSERVLALLLRAHKVEVADDVAEATDGDSAPSGRQRFIRQG